MVEALRQLCRVTPTREAAILSTCNRSELYLQQDQVEADAVLAPARSATEYGQLGELPFIEAFANETMRLKPIAPLNGLETNEGVELLGYYLPPNTPVLALTATPRSIPTISVSRKNSTRIDCLRSYEPRELL